MLYVCYLYTDFHTGAFGLISTFTTKTDLLLCKWETPGLKVFYGIRTGLDMVNGMDGVTFISSQNHNKYLRYYSTGSCSFCLTPSIGYSVVNFKWLEINTFLVVIQRFLFVHRAHKSHGSFLVDAKEPMHYCQMHLLL